MSSPFFRRLFVALCCTGFSVGAALAIGAQDYTALIRHMLLQEAERHFPNADIEVAVHLDPRLRLETCSAPDAQLRGQQRHGRVHVALRCGHPKAWSVNVPAEIRVKTMVMVASRALVRGQTLGAGDLTESLRPLERLGRDVLLPGMNLSGLTVRRALPEGTPLLLSHFTQAAAVRAGDNVRLSSGRGPIHIETRGKALEDGRIGDQIRIENITSGKTINGWVTDRGEVSTRPPGMLSAPDPALSAHLSTQLSTHLSTSGVPQLQMQ